MENTAITIHPNDLIQTGKTIYFFENDLFFCKIPCILQEVEKSKHLSVTTTYHK